VNRWSAIPRASRAVLKERSEYVPVESSAVVFIQMPNWTIDPGKRRSREHAGRSRWCSPRQWDSRRCATFGDWFYSW
jgi:hypothetical protein